MKIEVKEKDSELYKITYPCLLRSKETELVVLALEEYSDDCVNIVVLRGNDTWKVGAIARNFSLNSLEKFEGEIILKNE